MKKYVKRVQQVASPGRGCAAESGGKQDISPKIGEKEKVSGEWEGLTQLIFHGGKETVTIADADRDLFICNFDLALADMLDLADGNDIGTMRPDELPRRQFLRDGLQRHQRQNGFSGQVDLDVIVEPFDIKDFLEIDLDHLVIGFDEDIPFL